MIDFDDYGYLKNICYNTGNAESDLMFELLRLPRLVAITGFRNLGLPSYVAGDYYGLEYMLVKARAHVRGDGFEKIFKKKINRRIRALAKLSQRDTTR